MKAVYEPIDSDRNSFIEAKKKTIKKHKKIIERLKGEIDVL